MDASSITQGPVLWILVIAGAIIAATLFSMSSLRAWLSAARRAGERMDSPPKH
jgi:NADH:ubiquinone oxidoreductase subunit 6 (subunit J)